MSTQIATQNRNRAAVKIATIAIALLAAFALVFALTPHEAYAATKCQVVSSTKSKKTTKKKAAYKIVKYYDSKKFKVVKAKYSLSYPVLKGSSSQVKKINKSLRKILDNSWGPKKDIWNYARLSTESYYKGETFETTKGCKVVYNANGYFSFTQPVNWYGGGVYQHYTLARTYSLKTGKRLSVADVVKGSTYQVRQKIKDAYFNKFPDREDYYAHKELDQTKIGDFQFYLKKGKVVVCFGDYPPGGCHADGPCTITLKGNYL